MVCTTELASFKSGGGFFLDKKMEETRLMMRRAPIVLDVLEWIWF